MLLTPQQPAIPQKPRQKLSRSSEIVVHVMTDRLRLQDDKLQENHSLQMIGSWNLYGERRILTTEQLGVS